MVHKPQTSDTIPQAPLTHIAERLGKAAVTLTEAAQALSAAAKLLTPGHSKPPAQHNVEPNGSSDAHPMVSYESDTGSSPTEAESTRADGDASGLLRNDSRSELYTNPEDTSYYGSDRGDNQPKHSGSLAGEPATADESCVGPTESKNSTNPDRAYRMLVDHEVDVLLFTCGVIGRSQKVVCYMCCSVPVLYIFQKLISEITETPVFTISKVTPTELERAGAEFLSKERSVIILPESVAPRLVLDGKGTCVVHVGWPAKESLYESQLKAHQAEDNVVIAYTEDRGLYPAGATIVRRSEPWPGNTESFQISIAILRPLFDQKLAEFPYHLKGKIYPEWINFHGPNGQRHVTSWTPSVLVHRANTYLLDVLRYDILRFNPNGVEYALQVSLPEVSSGFVKTNGLESAVEEGILRVAKTNSGLNHMSSLSRGDLLPTATTSLNETTPAGSQRPTRPNSGLDFYSQSNIIPTTSVEPKTFLPTSGYTYFAVEEEFDAIPLLCFLALEHPTERVVIFLDDLGCLPHYQKLVKHSINKITGRMVMVAQGTTSEEQAQSNQNAALAFIACSTPMILLLPYRLSKLPPALENSTVGCCVYWGAGDFVALSQAQRNNTRLKSNTTHIIMTTVQRDSRRSTIKVSEHPSSPELANFGSSSWLSPMRETARSVLANNQQIARGLYGAYCYFFGKTPRSVTSAQEVARQLNRYSARILLRGKAEDGSTRFPPISGGFSTPARLVKAFDLQPAVDAGLLTIG